MESQSIPDSTTKEKHGFSEGEDVLLQQKDGRFYLGTVVMVELANERCLVKFGDNTQKWSKFKELCRLSMSENEQPSCVVCKKNNKTCNNDIRTCDKCGRGYHQLCHQPKISMVDVKFACQRCVKQQHQEILQTQKQVKQVARKQGATKNNFKKDTQSSLALTLPYDPGELSWDVNHRTNSEQKYCYCGKPGEWFMRMVQCGRCRQWFHDRCLRCVHYELFCGDRFYVFVCAICNRGNEFIRRLELTWVDLVHVALYNLTVIFAKKYYDLDTVIVPYINDNWEEWQLPAELASASMKQRRDQILCVLQNDKIRFKCGREIKKRTSIWGLRNRMPPYAPFYSLPSEGVVDEEVLKRVSTGNRRLRFINPPSNFSNMIKKKKLFRLPPNLYETPPALNGESGLLQFRDLSPPKLVPEGKVSISPISGAVSADEGHCYESGSENSDEGEVPTKRPRNCQIELQRRRKRWREQHKRAGLRLLESRGCKQNPKVSSSSSVLLAASCKLACNKDSEDRTSMITKKARKLVKNALNKGHQKSHKLQTSSTSPEPAVPPPPCTTPNETSGDESSSRTLDSFIPPPKDFEGANNPFVTDSSTPAGVPPPLVPPPKSQKVRHTKRQLSERDIRIGKNGEVKRRRFRRRNLIGGTKIPASQLYNRFQIDRTVKENVQLRTSYHRSSKQPLLGGAVSRSGATCVADALNSGRSAVAASAAAASTSCPEQVSMEEINHYFGAANRIASGENFRVIAKRTLPGGKLQFLLEWDSPAS